MTVNKYAQRKSLGKFTAGKVGNSIKITIPVDAHVKSGEQLELFQEADGRLTYEPVKKHVNIWRTDFVKNHDFEHDKEVIGELQGRSTGREV